MAMRRSVTYYRIDKDEVENLVSYLREKSFYVHLDDSEDSTRKGDYFVYSRVGRALIHRGSINNLSQLQVDYNAEGLLGVVEEYIKGEDVKSTN